MTKVVELIEALYVREATDRFPQDEEILQKGGQRRECTSITSVYKSERINLEEKDWEKKLERIMKKKIKSCMRERGLLDPTDVVIDFPLTKEVMAYLNSGKLSPPPIDPCDRTKGPVYDV